MYLHEDKELFEELIYDTENRMKIPAAIIEKDYFVTLFLKEIALVQPNIIFKGGTSLSKCYKIIKRFSEDIDLSIETDSKPTEGQRRHLKEGVVQTIDKLGFCLTNPEHIRSRRDFNRYVIDYPFSRSTSFLKQHIVVETAIFIRAYPSKRMNASSFIYDYLLSENQNDVINKYNLQPFELNVQTAERTFIDKIFALCDYYLSDAVNGHSRHIYDIYKLLEIIDINEELSNLAADVRNERKKHETCLSAKDGIAINDTLKEIIHNEVYKTDYENITSEILFEKVPYDTAVKGLTTVCDSKLFN